MIEYSKERYFSDGFQVTERIYALINPENEKIFYVGKTTKPLSDRLWGHIAAAKKKGIKFNNIIKDQHIIELLNKGLRPKIKEIERITPISYIAYLEIPEREIYWMKHFREAGHPIMNVMGLHSYQPNSKYIWYLESRRKGVVSPEYYYCGKDANGNKLYHKERLLSDGQQWLESRKEYNPYENPRFLKKMGLSVT